VHPICCGLDVHKKSVSACIIFSDGHDEESNTKSRYLAHSHTS
jgi:hypothetical protein